MALPNDTIKQIFSVRETIGLVFGLNGQPALFPLTVTGYEYVNTLYDFSLGSASSLSNTGTGWQAIQDSSNVYLLRPSVEDQVWQFFYGINPGFAWVYRSYPNGQTRGGLSSPITIGGTTGYIRGTESPYIEPSSVTEFWTAQGVSPAFNGYHPFGSPSSITVRMNFYGIKYKVKFDNTATPKRLITVGGIDTPMEVPEWLARKVRQP